MKTRKLWMLLLLTFMACTYIPTEETLDEITENKVLLDILERKEVVIERHSINISDYVYKVENNRIYFKDIPLKNGVTVSGWVDQPTQMNPFNGEFHVTAFGGSNDFMYTIVYPPGTTGSSFIGVFTQLGPGVYDWCVMEDVGLYIIQHSYPAFTIEMPTTYLTKNYEQRLEDTFGAAPGRN